MWFLERLNCSPWAPGHPVAFAAGTGVPGFPLRPHSPPSGIAGGSLWPEGLKGWGTSCNVCTVVVQQESLNVQWKVGGVWGVAWDLHSRCLNGAVSLHSRSLCAAGGFV